MSLNPFSFTSGTPYARFRPFIRQRVATLITEEGFFLELLLEVLRDHYGGCFSRLMSRVCTAWRDAVRLKRDTWSHTSPGKLIWTVDLAAAL